MQFSRHEAFTLTNIQLTVYYQTLLTINKTTWKPQGLKKEDLLRE